ncbi:MAG: carboxypeptidase-like regulatory domain-containing protein [Planctomycetota bacterium]
MRSLVPLASIVVLALALLAFFLLGRGPAREGVVDVDARLVPEDVAPPDEVAPLVEAVAAAERSEVSEVEAAAEPETAAPTDAPSCSILGVVVDAEQRPLPDALIQLAQFQEWNPDGAGAAIAQFGATRWKSMIGFEVRTAADGSFRLEVPEPSGERQAFYAAADRHHDSFTLWFGGTRGQTRPTLTAGEHDLGAIVLGGTGAIRGQVTDASGAPMEGVRIGIGETKSTTLGRYATTGPDGRYVLAHAPVGTYGVDAEMEGWVDQFIAPVTVEAGRDAGPVDFALERAPTLTGRVVDVAGAPIEKVRLWGWPESSGSGAGTRSKADGTFLIALPQEEPYTLEATHPDFVKWGSANDRSTLYEPGMSDLEIVMTPAEKTTFHVVDAATKEPIERFGLRILQDNGSKAKKRVYTEKRRPKLEDHPGGTALSSGRPGEDIYVVHADGYLLASGDIEHDVEGEPVQTVELRLGGRLIGRVVEDGAPVEGANVDVVRSRGSRVDENTLLRTVTDAEGRFTLAGLAGGGYRLTVRPRAGAPVVREGLSCRAGEDTDLGEVALVPGGTITGTVLLPAGVDPGDLTVRRGAWEDGHTTTTDASGRFHFESVPAGKQTLYQEGRPGAIDSGGTTTVEVVSGETADVTIDATDLVLVPIQIAIDLGPLPAKDARVTLLAVDAPESMDFRSRKRWQIDLGRTNEDGVASAAGRPIGPSRVRLRLASGGALEHPTARVDVIPGGSVEATVAFELASMKLTGVDALPLSGKGTLNVVLESDGWKSLWNRVEVPFEEGELRPEEGPFQALDGGALTVRGLGPGSYTMTVYGQAAGAPDVRTDLGDGSFRMGPERMFERTYEVTLEVGAQAEVDVR